jgi:Ras-related protein Rab-28
MAADDRCKVIFVGNGSVGKTSLIRRVTSEGFERVYRQTIGADFFERRSELGGGCQVAVELWDIGGQGLQSKMLSTYLSGAKGVFLCYDMTDAESFRDVEFWLERVREHAGKPVIYLLGNKADLLRERRVSESEHAAFIARNGLHGGVMVSARSGDLVLRTFYELAGRASGHPLSERELSFYDRVVEARVDRGDDAAADEAADDPALRKVMEEDAAAERRRAAAIARAAAAPEPQPCCALA